MKLGNKEDAQLIYRRRRSGNGPLPKGWKKLGEGAYRSTYLSPEGVVYKVNGSTYDGDHNFIEAMNFRRIRSSKVKVPRTWRVAKTKLYTFDHDDDKVNVVAMEYVKGEHKSGLCTSEQEEKYFEECGAIAAWDALGLDDLHEGNFVITPKGTKVIIDLGE
jgi:hypothetical protein